MVVQYLESRYSQLVAARPGDAYLSAIYESLRSANELMHILYSHGLWLPRPVAIQVVQVGYCFLGKYLQAAYEALQIRKTRFKLTPKYHAWAHICDYVRNDLKYQAKWFMNPVTWSTQQDEDFTGRVSSLSLAVASRTAHLQVMAPYAINLWDHWGDWKA